MGDFNWVTPSFLAFASPQHKPIAPVSQGSPQWAALPKTIAEVQRSKELPTPFKNVLTHFSSRNIGLVVRLNSELYSPSYFTALGIQHLDMIFDDGTCPPLSLVKKFINLAHEMITIKRKGIAVHCKAGLGRTGCLIGAYLIYRYGFTANEIIAFMRFMRPGMVVGPQQHWLHLNQGTFREWWFEDTMREKLAAAMPSTPTRVHKQRDRLASNGQTFTPPNGSQSRSRSVLGEIGQQQHQQQQAQAQAQTQQKDADSMCVDKETYDQSNENLPAPTPGQPRKTSKIYGMGSCNPSPARRSQHAESVKPDTEIVSMQRVTQGESESEEEFQLRMLARRASRSPGSSPAGKRRAVSCTTTTTQTTTWGYPGTEGENSDVENADAKPKTPARVKSDRSGSGTMSVSKIRSSPRRSTEGKNGNGVRKTSGRIGSAGGAMGAAAGRMK